MASRRGVVGGRLGMPMAEVEQVFRWYDANGDGKISVEELASVLRALGAPPGPGKVRCMMEEMDADCDGFVDLSEFAAFHCGPYQLGKGGGGADAKEQELATEAGEHEPWVHTRVGLERHSYLCLQPDLPHRLRELFNRKAEREHEPK